jgi:hypothetical protein
LVTVESKNEAQNYLLFLSDFVTFISRMLLGLKWWQDLAAFCSHRYLVFQSRGWTLGIADLKAPSKLKLAA